VLSVDGTIDVEINSVDVEIDPVDAEIDPVDAEIDPVDVEIDPVIVLTLELDEEEPDEDNFFCWIPVSEILTLFVISRIIFPQSLHRAVRGVLFFSGFLMPIGEEFGVYVSFSFDSLGDFTTDSVVVDSVNSRLCWSPGISGVVGDPMARLDFFKGTFIFLGSDCDFFNVA
jgi:hypothetical protein